MHVSWPKKLELHEKENEGGGGGGGGGINLSLSFHPSLPPRDEPIIPWIMAKSAVNHQPHYYGRNHAFNVHILHSGLLAVLGLGEFSWYDRKDAEVQYIRKSLWARGSDTLDQFYGFHLVTVCVTDKSNQCRTIYCSILLYCLILRRGYYSI